MSWRIGRGVNSRIPSMLCLCALVLVLLAGRAWGEMPWAFVVMGDPRPGAPGDPEAVGFRADLDAMKASIIDNAGDTGLPVPELIIICGDIDEVATTELVIQQWEADNNYSLPFFPVIGNHDTAQADLAAIEEIYDLHDAEGVWNLDPGPAGTEKLTYSFDYKNAHFAVLNCYWDGADHAVDDISRPNIVPNLRSWLADDLAATELDFKFVCVHAPAWPFGRHVGESLDHDPENRDRFWALLGQYGVEACFVGHTHKVSTFQWLGNWGNIGRGRWPAEDEGRYTSRIIPDAIGTWQIDSGAARGVATSDYDRAFVHVIVDATQMQFRVWVDDDGWRVPANCVDMHGRPNVYDSAVPPSPCPPFVCCGVPGWISSLGLALGMVLLSRFGGYRRRAV